MVRRVRPLAYSTQRAVLLFSSRNYDLYFGLIPSSHSKNGSDPVLFCFDWSAGILPATPQRGVKRARVKFNSFPCRRNKLASQAGRQDACAPVTAWRAGCDWSAGILPATPQRGVKRARVKFNSFPCRRNKLASQAGRQDACAPVTAWRAGCLRSSRSLQSSANAGAREGPVCGFGTQPGLDGVVFYVSHRADKMLQVSDVAVERFDLPKLAGTPEDLIRFVCRV